MTPDPSDDFRDLEIVVLRNMLSQTTHAYEEKMGELFAEKELAQVTLASIGDAVITTDAAARVTYLNPVATTLTGWPAEEAEGRPIAEVLRLVDEDQESVPLDLAPVLSAGQDLDLAGDLTLARRDGQFFSVELRVRPLRDHDQAIIGLALVIQDVSEKKLMSLQLTRAAHCDRLTGLLNREAFYSHLRKALERAPEHEAVLCYLDLDQFKVINDTCGYAAGDLLLQWIGSLIRERVRDSDVLARIGSDEFGLLLDGCTVAGAREVAENVHRGLRAFRFAWEGRSFNVSVAIGLVPVTGEFKDLMDLLGAADHACHLAKEKGRRRIHVYEREEVRLHFGLMHWVMRLQRALEEGRFVLYWQRIRPLHDAARNRQFFEVLVRMQTENADEEGDVHEPSEFLAAAERYGLMPAIDRWVVTHAFEILAAQPPEILGMLDCCSINLSGSSMGDESFLGHVERELDRTRVPAERICFEVTETAAVSHLGRAAEMMRALSDRGCQWALDDFGSGMSSYRYLQELPVDFLKIDGHIVTDMMTNSLSRAMVKSINQIAHAMSISTVAEAVSGRAMANELADLGLDYAQGFWVERPRPIRLPESFHTLAISSDWHREPPSPEAAEEQDELPLARPSPDGDP